MKPSDFRSMLEVACSRWAIPLATIALACLVGAVFFPILGFEFVELDVAELVVQNLHIRALTLENLKQIFSLPENDRSYYPVRTLTFALDYHLWGGLVPRGFKLTNGLIHLANVLLLFWLVLRVFRRRENAASLPGVRDVLAAAFSAAVFAIHPVVVEPVAWVLGREELLMTLGALGCMHFHLTARRLEEDPRSGRRAVACYVLAAFCCAVACLSSVKAAIIPAIVAAWDVLTLARPRFWRILRATAALWGIGLLTIAIQMVCKYRSLPEEPAVLSSQRLMLISSGYWLNLRALVWPADLTLFHWESPPVSFLDEKVILGSIAICLTLLLLWTLRRRKFVLFGLLWFCLALTPSSQLVTHHIHRADRFMYLPLTGLAVAMGLGLARLSDPLKRSASIALAAAGVLLLVVLGAGSAVYVQTWQNTSTMWENSVRVYPDNADAHGVLADALGKDGQYDRAFGEYETAIRLQPERADLLSHFAFLLATCGEPLCDYDRALQLAQTAFDRNPELFGTLSIVCGRCAQALASRGEFDQAVELYRRAIALGPNNQQALIGLAQILTGSAGKRLSDPAEAVRLAQRACKPAMDPEPQELDVLAAAYAAAGRFDEAVATAKTAVAAAEAAGDSHGARRLRHRLELFQMRSAGPAIGRRAQEPAGETLPASPVPAPE